MDPGSCRLLRPAWIVSHLLVAGLLVATVNMGFWQLRRLDGRQAHNVSVAARAGEPVLPLVEVLASIAAGADPADLRFVRVIVTGVWDADREVLLANRSQDGVPGVHAVSLLLVDGANPGTASDAGLAEGLVVDRGFVPRPVQLAGDPGVWAPDTGEVVLAGSLDLFRAGERGHGGEVDRIDREALETRWDTTLAPLWLRSAESTGSGTWPTPAPVVDLGDGPHRSYAVQWFVFSIIGILGYPLVLVRLTSDSGGRSNRSVPEWDAPVA
jgi:cytochrome oxidase assembly protein ShyY1